MFQSQSHRFPYAFRPPKERDSISSPTRDARLFARPFENRCGCSTLRRHRPDWPSRSAWPRCEPPAEQGRPRRRYPAGTVAGSLCPTSLWPAPERKSKRPNASFTAQWFLFCFNFTNDLLFLLPFGACIRRDRLDLSPSCYWRRLSGWFRALMPPTMAAIRMGVRSLPCESSTYGALPGETPSV